jgi:hypothetical protein
MTFFRIPLRAPHPPGHYDQHDESVWRAEVTRAIQDLNRLIEEATSGLGGGGGGGGHAIAADTGRWWLPGIYGIDTGNSTSLGMGENIVKAYPFVPAQTVTVNEMACEVTLARASTNVQLGIYDNTGVLYPGALIATTGNISTASTGVKTAAVTAVELTGGSVYWLAIGRFDGTTNPNFRGWTTSVTHQTSVGLSNIPSFTTLHDTQIRIDHTVDNNLPNPFTTLNLTYLNNHKTQIALRTQ